MNRCPICRGRVNTASCCVRCDANLQHLMLIEQHSRQYCKLAVQSLLTNDVHQAVVFAKKAMELQCTPFTQALYQFVERNLV